MADDFPFPLFTTTPSRQHRQILHKFSVIFQTKPVMDLFFNVLNRTTAKKWINAVNLRHLPEKGNKKSRPFPLSIISG